MCTMTRLDLFNNPHCWQNCTRYHQLYPCTKKKICSTKVDHYTVSKATKTIRDGRREKAVKDRPKRQEEIGIQFHRVVILIIWRRRRRKKHRTMIVGYHVRVNRSEHRSIFSSSWLSHHIDRGTRRLIVTWIGGHGYDVRRCCCGSCCCSFCAVTVQIVETENNVSGGNRNSILYSYYGTITTSLALNVNSFIMEQERKTIEKHPTSNK